MWCGGAAFSCGFIEERRAVRGSLRELVRVTFCLGVIVFENLEEGS